ncbi:hypothetical protein LOTGIDRAFT_104414 [Lottia gigantea]|uniref:Uncharacterized protein n=1 Tax=Lottia gigantea TaxID=225164 RepID=V4AK99_LOTGI|nr:hypothetical protein LOTGIDRAFT_104414 [Lottia gigantea]ESO97527.1 hypothetical protein LOTGIDRAFT_104414 [Lottia gigantea]
METRFKEVKNEARQDWHQTSTGVGHHYRPGYYFPDSQFRSVMNEPLPRNLAAPDEIIDNQRYDTTTGKAHDNKHPGTTYNNLVHLKPPGHWKVNYVKDLAEKLGQGGWRRPLTMGNQKTETQDNFRAQPGIKDHYRFEEVYHPQGFLLQDYHNEGPSKVSSTTNPKLQGKPFYVRDGGVLPLLDPYLSTTHKHHRSFKPSELKKYPKKDIATYWDCEEYPKSMGFGMKENPLPKNSVPRDRLPMRDTMVFPTATKIPRQPKALVPVPHSGLKSVYKDNYTRPSDVRMKHNHYCPVDTPYTLPDPGTNSIMTAPKMYTTEYKNVGSGKPIVV